MLETLPQPIAGGRALLTVFPGGTWEQEIIDIYNRTKPTSINAYMVIPKPIIKLFLAYFLTFSFISYQLTLITDN